MLLEIFCQKLIVSNVILALLDHLIPKIFFFDQPWWPTQSVTLFQNFWILPWNKYLLTRKTECNLVCKRVFYRLDPNTRNIYFLLITAKNIKVLLKYLIKFFQKVVRSIRFGVTVCEVLRVERSEKLLGLQKIRKSCLSMD